jgi:hypothetical protein
MAKNRRLPFFIISMLLLAEQARILFEYSRYYTNIDQTLLWFASKEAVHGRLHEPNFYGQTYNTVFESAPGALLHLIGLPFGLAIPLSTTLFVSVIWVALAVTAYLKGKYLVALLALAAPLILRVQYLLLYDAPRGIMAGDFLAIIAVICALYWCKKSPMKLASLIALGGVAVLWDYAAALIVVPVIIYILFKDWRKIKSQLIKVFFICIGSTLMPIGWLLIQKNWYSSHPYDLTANSISTKPQWTVFLHSISHFSSYLAFFAPVLVPIADVAAVLFCVFLAGLILVAIKRRSYGLFFSTLSLALLTSLVLSLPHAGNYAPGLYLSRSRLLLTMPIAVWVLIFLSSLDNNSYYLHFYNITKFQAMMKKTAAWLFIVIVVLSFGVTQLDFKTIVARATYSDVSANWIINPSRLIDTCQRINNTYVATNAQLFATNDGTLAYGCAAQYNNLNTIEPIYDRRGWIIDASFKKPIERILIQGKTCYTATPKRSKCTVEKGGFLLIQTKPTVAAKTLIPFGLQVKNYQLPSN